MILKLSLKVKMIVIVSTLFALILFFMVVSYFQDVKAESLAENGFMTVAVIEKTKDDVLGGKSQKRDLIYFYFIKNDTVFHDMKSLNWVGIHHYVIKVGNSFEMQVDASDYSNFNINFSKRILSDGKNESKYTDHVYN
ncbi:MAG: hypothetical protein AB8B74_07540 [Crocinitomicaceae bacterium]